MPAIKSKIECPVCGMEVSENPKLKVERKGQTFYFCSENDMKEFQKRPHVYAWKEPKGKAGKVA
jgi:YHS domain-containing protein